MFIILHASVCLSAVSCHVLFSNLYSLTLSFNYHIHSSLLFVAYFLSWLISTKTVSGDVLWRRRNHVIQVTSRRVAVHFLSVVTSAALCHCRRSVVECLLSLSSSDGVDVRSLTVQCDLPTAAVSGCLHSFSLTM